MDITKKAGYPIWFINNRSINKPAISLNEAMLKAQAFLRETGFKDLEEFESTQYDSVGVINFVSKVNGVRIYPESIKVKVALDNGDIIGLSAEDYLKSFQTRVIVKPALTAAEARKKINPSLKVMEERQAVILNDLNKEVLCYEFLGTLGDDTYRIYINAKNGTEEEVEKLKNVEVLGNL